MLVQKLNAMAARAKTDPVSRRGFLLGAAATSAGVAIGFRPLAGLAATEPAKTGGDLAAYIAISEDDTVTIYSSQFDMGQGSYHGIATLVLEELGADWRQVRVEGASGNLAHYGNMAWGGGFQGSGGSTSMTSSWDRYRKAGAAGRMMLAEAAAREWGVPASEIAVEKGVVAHAGSGKSSGFGAFAKAAAGVSIPDDIKLKDRSEWTEIGNEGTKRYDRVGKTRGAQDFTIDVKLPGMLTAVMIHPPKFGAKVASFDAADAKAVKGVSDVVAIHRGVAVVAKDMWTALKARDLVTVEWDESEAETRGSAEIMAAYNDLAVKAPMAVARKDGDPEGAMASAAKVIEASYEFPYLAHAAMEPLNAVAAMNADGVLEIWGGHQMPDYYQQMASKTADIPPENIRMHVMKTGGGFGRRATPDADVITEVTAIGKAIGWKAPVKLQWTRENDMRGGRYRPAYVHRMRAGLDADGKLVAWDNHIVGQSIVANTLFSGLIKDGVDATSVEGSSTLPYAIPNLGVGLTTTESKVPVLWWRSVGSTHTAYATEVFLDEVIAEIGADQVQFRLDLLKDHPRHAGVLKLAAEEAGWGTPLPDGHHWGVAVHESFHSYVAEIAEVSVEDGEVIVHRVVAAVDVGTPINPDVIRAQVEGGIGFGLGSVLQEELTLTDGEVDQGNYDGYLPLRIDRMPKVEVHIVPSTEPPTGIGEPGVPPIGPAVANAVFRASGKRVRTLPFEKGFKSA
ncbi:xanthine dehydrogenase family protein molybdopterin-binding subunit [Nisaea acidiphila]|uniref:Xanthine dehydrogenase family protein molybdopterin-binding subunit n=1 Tax=Nisaea acidiphila TaxID=1862145 RepID=A0A9J7ATK1_9PROT|nr:xanthine dehydrogenase family protein molybdopterin-binding subunit [Nisaea acidiphila]UUX51019.1 xanthine dehydrogenase family protein molybdopterin-binding subunit [Nisaea acidiphila]